MAGKSKSSVNPDLEKMMSALLKEATAKDADGKPVMSLTDKMKVIDRCLKLEMIKSKLQDEGYGSGFD